MEQSRQTALVTGGAVRIGRALALTLARDGVDIVLHFRSNRAAAEETAQVIRDLGRQAWLVCGALEAPDAVGSLFQEAVAQAGHVDILINNAAVFTHGTLAETAAADFESVWRVNTLAPILLTRALAAHIRARGPDAAGVVVNLLDQRISGLRGGSLAYSLSKRALADFTRAAAVELAPQVRVNAVAPGPVLPPPAGAPHEPTGPLPLGRRPTPQEVADAARFLVRARSVTGQILFVDGGQHLVTG